MVSISVKHYLRHVPKIGAIARELLSWHTALIQIYPKAQKAKFLSLLARHVCPQTILNAKNLFPMKNYWYLVLGLLFWACSDNLTQDVQLIFLPSLVSSQATSVVGETPITAKKILQGL
jgi:hypothetical protein